MNHLTDGQIRAALDGELAGDENRHLQGCSACQARLNALSLELQTVRRQLSFLETRPEDARAPARAALARFHARYHEKKETSMFRKIFASRAVRVGLAVALLLALVLSIPSTRAWAGQFLGLFRVQQVTVLPVDISGISNLTGNQALGQQISRLMSRTVQVTKEAGPSVPVADAAAASAQAGFTVRLPAAASAPVLSVHDSSAYEMTIDRARVQAVIDEAGRADLVLPESLDGAEVSVAIPASVTAAYGTCPEPDQEAEHEGLSRRYADCLLLSQIPSPTVTAPPDVDFSQLAALGLEFIGMSRAEADAFSQTVDWTTSLVIPIPRNAAEYQTVTVDGVEGKLIEHVNESGAEFVLIWVKDGIIHSLAGWGNRADQAIEMANSLQ